MLKTGLDVAAICAVLVTLTSCADQNKDQNATAATLVSTDIIAVIGSDADARAVVAQVLAEIAHLRATVFLASQIRREWLPIVQASTSCFCLIPKSAGFSPAAAAIGSSPIFDALRMS